MQGFGNADSNACTTIRPIRALPQRGQISLADRRNNLCKYYPLRKTREYTIGIYSSLDKTYEALQAYVVDDSYKLWEKKYTMGFIVRETKLDDKLAWGISIHTYTKTGEPNDELFIADEEYPDWDKPFYGRPK